MFLVMGITGKVGGATAMHLLAHGKRVRALVRSREKAADWMEQGVKLVEAEKKEVIKCFLTLILSQLFLILLLQNYINMDI